MDRFTLDGDRLLERVKALLHEGNVRHIRVRNSAGDVLFEAPLTLGVIGFAAVPLLGAIAAAIAMASDCTIDIERVRRRS